MLVRQFENDWKITKAPWLACAADRAWCEEISDRLATTLINAQARNLFYGHTGGAGFVLAPTVELFCVYPEDGNSLAKKCTPLGGDGSACIPGCYPSDEQCEAVGHDYTCSFGPGYLRMALEAQQARPSYKARNNEVVVDAKSMEAALPDSIEAFFYMPSASAEEIAIVRGARQDLLDEYDLSDETGPPLLMLDLTDPHSMNPFSASDDVR